MTDEESRTRLPPPWPAYAPFKASQRETYRDGIPDFPATAGGREQGKFRPSVYPLLTTVGVVNDDGSPIAGTGSAQEEMLVLLRAMVFGLSVLTDMDLINEVSL